jgi:diguanylate cyclase (GGDEF)-like protein
MQQYLHTLEQSQSRFRLSFVAIFMVYLACAYHFDRTVGNTLSFCALALYLGFAAGVVVVSHQAKTISTMRLNVCIVIDQACMALLYVAFGEVGAPLLLCPALASIGYGVRYGPSYAYKSALAGLVCLIPAMAASPYWRSVPLAAAGLILSNSCLPVYAAAISQQLRKDNWRMQRRAKDLLVAKEAADMRARQDPLTGLLNRFGLDEAIDAIIRVPGGLVAVAAMDLDGFKHFNDTHGHQLGDELLVRVSDLIRFHIAGATARYDGDEFLFALKRPDTHRDVIDAFESLRNDIAALEVVPGVSVSASIGVYLVDGTAPVDRAEVLARADKLMYLAKRKGRDRIQTNCSVTEELV